jgi:SnoaL-like domain
VGSEADLAVIRRGLELFNSGDLETLFREVFHPEIVYHGEPNISVLTGKPVEVTGVDEVGAVWEAFFAMFDEVRLDEFEFDEVEGGVVLGKCRMLLRGGESQVPIDAPFYLAWVLRDGRWRFLAAKLEQAEVGRALADWRG